MRRSPLRALFHLAVRAIYEFKYVSEIAELFYQRSHLGPKQPIVLSPFVAAIFSHFISFRNVKAAWSPSLRIGILQLANHVLG
jgi:hypothetical protein